MPRARSRVRLDLNSPEFQEVFFGLEPADFRQVVASLRRLSGLDWSDLYAHSGFRWEPLEYLKGPSGATVHSQRLSQRIRTVAVREGELLRPVSLRPDRDSAYRRSPTRERTAAGERIGTFSRCDVQCCHAVDRR